MKSSGKVGNRSLRQVNRSVLLDLIRESDRISRSELARRSGLTKPTVSSIVDGLIREEVVREVGFSGSVSAGGRPARLLEFNADSAGYLGIEFGVQSTRVAVADARGDIRHVASAEAVFGEPEHSLAALGNLVASALKVSRIPKTRIRAAAATAPGLIDQTTGVCRLAPNLGWRDFPLRDAVEQLLKKPVVVMNPTAAAAIAEGRLGAAQGIDSFIWLALDSGVGAGVILDGRVFTGTRGFTGEIGHCRISDDDVPCGCGKSGHLEAFVSTAAVLRAAEYAALEHPDSRLSELSPMSSVAPVLQAAREGDATARAVLKRVGDDVAKGVAYLVNVLDPQMIVLGGELSNAGPVLVDSVAESLSEHALSAESVKVVATSLGERAILIGAVLLAMDRAIRSYRLVAAGVGPDLRRHG